MDVFAWLIMERRLTAPEGDLARPRWIWFLASVTAIGCSGYLIAQQDGRAPQADQDALAVDLHVPVGDGHPGQFEL